MQNGENPPADLAGELAGDLAQGLLRGAQLLGGQFPARCSVSWRAASSVSRAPREGLQVPAAGADRPSVHGLVPMHASDARAGPAALAVRADNVM